MSQDPEQPPIARETSNPEPEPALTEAPKRKIPLALSVGSLIATIVAIAGVLFVLNKDKNTTAADQEAIRNIVTQKAAANEDFDQEKALAVTCAADLEKTKKLFALPTIAEVLGPEFKPEDLKNQELATVFKESTRIKAPLATDENLDTIISAITNNDEVTYAAAMKTLSASATRFNLTNVSDITVEGDTASALVTASVDSTGEPISKTSTQYFIREDGAWKACDKKA
ncbi:MAG: hypothetical protein ACRCSF_02575 [Mycobacteriaceae bacterium]